MEKGARRRIISQTLTKMWPRGLCLRLHEFSIPSLPNWHPGVEPGKRASQPALGTIDGLVRAHRLPADSVRMIYEKIVESMYADTSERHPTMINSCTTNIYQATLFSLVT